MFRSPLPDPPPLVSTQSEHLSLYRDAIVRALLFLRVALTDGNPPLIQQTSNELIRQLQFHSLNSLPAGLRFRPFSHVLLESLGPCQHTEHGLRNQDYLLLQLGRYSLMIPNG